MVCHMVTGTGWGGQSVDSTPFFVGRSQRARTDQHGDLLAGDRDTVGHGDGARDLTLAPRPGLIAALLQVGLAPQLIVPDGIQSGIDPVLSGEGIEEQGIRQYLGGGAIVRGQLVELRRGIGWKRELQCLCRHDPFSLVRPHDAGRAWPRHLHAFHAQVGQPLPPLKAGRLTCDKVWRAR